jgi:hypothetical protein
MGSVWTTPMRKPPSDPPEARAKRDPKPVQAIGTQTEQLAMFADIPPQDPPPLGAIGYSTPLKAVSGDKHTPKRFETAHRPAARNDDRGF